MGGLGMAELVEDLPGMYKALSFIPSTSQTECDSSGQ